MSVVEAAKEAARLRLRPILMTSIAFIAGVMPLVFSFGAGAEMREAMGIAVFTGMIGVTVFGLNLTPVFYVLLRSRLARPASPRRSPSGMQGAPEVEVQSIAGNGDGAGVGTRIEL
jgi:Cu/Ag efflux pump CusA